MGRIKHAFCVKNTIQVRTCTRENQHYLLTRISDYTRFLLGIVTVTDATLELIPLRRRPCLYHFLMHFTFASLFSFTVALLKKSKNALTLRNQSKLLMIVVDSLEKSPSIKLI